MHQVSAACGIRLPIAGVALDAPVYTRALFAAGGTIQPGPIDSTQSVGSFTFTPVLPSLNPTAGPLDSEP